MSDLVVVFFLKLVLFPCVSQYVKQKRIQLMSLVCFQYNIKSMSIGGVAHKYRTYSRAHSRVTSVEAGGTGHLLCIGSEPVFLNTNRVINLCRLMLIPTQMVTAPCPPHGHLM